MSSCGVFLMWLNRLVVLVDSLTTEGVDRASSWEVFLM